MLETLPTMCICYITLTVTSLRGISSATTFSFPIHFIILCRPLVASTHGILNLQFPGQKLVQMT